MTIESLPPRAGVGRDTDVGPSRQLRVEVVCSRDQLCRLEESWSRLHQREARASGWTAPQLLVPFQQAYFPGYRPRVLVVRDADGTLRGILPLALEFRRVGPIYLRRVVALAGTQVVYPDAVIEPGAEPLVMPALTSALRRMSWDEIRLRWVEPGAHLLHVAHGLAQGVPELRQEPGDPLWKLSLRNQQELPRGSTRKEMLRRLRRLHERGEIIIGWEPEDRLAAAAEEFVLLHTRLKDHQQQIAFYRMGSARHDSPEWLVEEFAAGRAGLFSVRCDGQLIASAIILRHRERACCFRFAWEPAFATFGLGIMVVTKAIEACRERGDLDFDMGPGVEPYKGEFATRGGSTVTLTATRNTWRTRLARRWLRIRSLHEP